MKTLTVSRVAAVVALMIFGLLLRLAPHPANFSPATAMVFVAPLFLGFSIWSVALPFAALFVSDLILGFYPGASFVYLGYAMVALVGFYQAYVFRGQTPRMFKGLSFVVSTGASAVLFFLFSNLGVWLYGGLYARTWQGLVDCYVLAIPFFQNTLFSHVLYAFAFTLLPVALAKRFMAKA